ncbi:PepSY domain-containing protein [Altererythrobacter xixiisoli]|uniref:PepSY domain-containing protein n=1 Tax=Croceibacterium xixiisoli TaxID=1476466 RepID=A0A6I4TX79_9SPHN|nr:PepSY domain-containing protein [Croceibacterium xixiisoli]MXO99840.1 PepSY domain-containing protein [Croceibacterium xixiisoli]
MSITRTAKARTISLMAAAGMIGGAFLAVPASADTPGPRWMNVAQVTRAIARQGYRVVEIEADNGRWEGEMIRGYRRFEFHANPRTGRLTWIRRD